jgi:hypothetical protein
MRNSEKSAQAQSFLRDTLHPPRLAQFLTVHPGNLDTEKLARFINDIWSDLIYRLENPIQITEDNHTRVVEFIGTIRYIIDKNSGMFRSETLGRTEEGLKFVEEKALIAVDPPLRANGGWIEVYLNQRWDEMAAVLIDHTKPGESWLGTVRRVIWQSVRKSSDWKRLRNAMRAALDLDPQVLRWSRQGRSRHVNQCVSNYQYNRTVAFRQDYEQVERDNPNLVWLFTMMLDEKIELPPGEVIAVMKTYLAGKRVSPAGWRLLANGNEHHFRHIRDWIGPDGELRGRVAELPYWLRFMVALRRSGPLRPALREIFLHDSFKTDTNGLVRFRNVWMPVTVVNSILKEAEQRLQRGGLTAFLENDVNRVVAWLEADKPDLDSNQLRAGWKYLASSASKWQVEKELAGELGELQWESALGELRIGDWTVVPLDDAWKLRSEGVLQKHCADRYLNDCLQGNKRLFSVRHDDGRRIATIGIKLSGDAWYSFGIRRSCNRPVGVGLAGLDDEVASRYTDLWRLTQPTSPEHDCDNSDLSDDEVLRAHENRLGLAVDENDPMLPAVIAMERALMRMAEKHNPTQAGEKE